MIEFNGLKNDILRTIKTIHSLKGVSVGARLLAESVFLKPSDWKVNWAWFAKELGVSVNSVKRWVSELCKCGILEIETNSKLANGTELKIKFLMSNLDEMSNLDDNKKDKFENFNFQQERKSFACACAHEGDENLADENFVLQKESETINQTFQADLNALNSGQNQSEIDDKIPKNDNLPQNFNVGEFSQNFAKQSADNGKPNTNNSEQKSERVADTHDLRQKAEPIQSKPTKRERQKEARLREADECFNERLSDILAFKKSDWDEWVAHKIARCGVRFTRQTWKNDIEKLIGAGFGAKAMINHSIACAYQGLFAPHKAQSYGAYQNAANQLDGLPFFSNKYDEHNFIIKELLKIDDDADFFIWSDDEIAKVRVKGYKILKINGFFAFSREQTTDNGLRTTEYGAQNNALQTQTNRERKIH